MSAMNVTSVSWTTEMLSLKSAAVVSFNNKLIAHRPPVTGTTVTFHIHELWIQLCLKIKEKKRRIKKKKKVFKNCFVCSATNFTFEKSSPIVGAVIFNYIFRQLTESKRNSVKNDKLMREFLILLKIWLIISLQSKNYKSKEMIWAFWLSIVLCN